MTKSNEILSSYQALCSLRSPWESWWSDLRPYVTPSRHERDEYVPNEAHSLYDTTAVESCQKLASGHMSYICPSNEVWFKWSSPDADPSDEEQSWYSTCSEIANRELALSNFYTELHECFLDRVGLGTGSLYCDSNRKVRLHFRHIPCGQFLCAEDDEGKVNTYMREFSLSPLQAESQFGKENLGTKAKQALSDPRRALDTQLQFLHVVRPRAIRDRRRRTAKNMLFESIYYSIDDAKVVEESGYQEFPYMVTRFLKWGNGPYGIAPARLAFTDIKQTQFLNRILDMLGEVAAFPRILELANQVGEVDLRAGGRTLINTESASLGFPREWATQGRYDVGVDRLKQKQDAIKRAFFIPMLELWSERKQQMTATEVYARENERVMLFSPSFSLFSHDCQVMMDRVFSLLFRLGRFPKPPASVIRNDSVEEPLVVYQGRIAMVMRRMQSEGLELSLRRLQQMASMDANLADHVDLDRSYRLAARMDGIPEQLLRPEFEVKRRRKKREAAATAQQEQEAQAMQSESQGLAQLQQMMK